MPIDAESLKWVEVADFSPGIYSPRGTYLESKSANQIGQQQGGAPLGAASLWHATRDTSTPTAPVNSPGTYGCICVPGKGLVGAPRRSTANDVLFDPAAGITGAWPTQEPNHRALIIASHVISPIITGDEVNGTLPQEPVPPLYKDELAVAFSRFYDPASGTAFNNRVLHLLFKLFASATGGTSFTLASSLVPTRTDSTNWAAPFYHAIADFSQNVQQFAFLNYTYNALLLLLNVPESRYTGSGNHAQRISQFPSQDTFPLDGIKDVAGIIGTDYYAPVLIFAHEGRLCAIDSAYSGYPVFGTDVQFDGADDIAYWDTRHVYADVPTFFQKPIEENQSGIRVAQSINANELFLVKAQGGGAVIMGDLDFPTVRRLPGIHSTGDVYCKATNTPDGVAYAGRGGIFLWSGAETSQCISEQLDGQFWSAYSGVFSAYTPAANRWGFEGQMGFLYPWILAPSFFMYDTRFQSWWLLDKPNANMPSFSGQGTTQGHIIEVFPEVNDNTKVVARRYFPELQAIAWAWTCQPITPEKFRTSQMREVNILATGYGSHSPTITITARGLPDASGVDTTEQHVVTLAGNGAPAVYRVQFALQCQSFVVSFDAASNDASTPAPTLHSFRIGYETLAETPFV